MEARTQKAENVDKRFALVIGAAWLAGMGALLGMEAVKQLGKLKEGKQAKGKGMGGRLRRQ